MGKLLKKEGESSKISIRHARKNTMDVLKAISGEDERKRIEKQVRPHHVLTDQLATSIYKPSTAVQIYLLSTLQRGCFRLSLASGQGRLECRCAPSESRTDS